ncbi:arylsulfotransferase family protein, partial [Candidatus Pelagibacter sp.]|nr:arylsulfotransferase family protein [Candidatus Pelagibacter sp.]
FDGDHNRASVEIIDLNDFSVIHKYDPDIELINKKALENNKEEFFRIKAEANENRFLLYHPLIDRMGNLISHSEEGPFFKLNICNDIDWVNSKERFHHSNEIDHEGNYWVPSYMEPYSKTMQKYRNRSGLLDDAITKISKDGKILYQKSIFDILIEGKVVKYNDLYFNGDPIHLNDIQPVINDTKHWKKGDLFLSLRNLNTIILYRPSDNKVLKVINGPFVMQHDVDIISDNEISIFNNNFIFTKSGPDAQNIDVLIYNFDTNEFYKKYPSAMIEYDVVTGAGGLSEFLNDGSLLIEEQGSGRILLIDNNGKLEWEYININKNKSIYQTTWSRIIKEKSMIDDLKKAIKNKNCK